MPGLCSDFRSVFCGLDVGYIKAEMRQWSDFRSNVWGSDVGLKKSQIGVKYRAGMKADFKCLK
jgi:hypothetical protein